MIIKNGNTFHLKGKSMSYIAVIGERGDLLHYHFGKKLADRDYSGKIKKGARPLICCDENGFFLETKKQEYPAYGHLDMRNPAYSVKNKFGNRISRLYYKDYAIKDGETAYIKGMPSLFKGDSKPSTLEITLEEQNAGFEVVLSYTVFEEYDIIARSAKIVNKSGGEITLEACGSANVDFENNRYELVYFPGAWSRERELVRTKIKMGEKINISAACGASSHTINPFVMLCSENATEKSGEVYGFSLIYSGDHSTVAECDTYGFVRITQGINPVTFEQVLEKDEEFYTPQSVISYSQCGFGGISRQMHDVYRNNLCKSKWAYKDRPILINNWEATYFDFNEEKLLQIVKKAKEIGVELFVLDDGWFGKRNNDKCSLGDWVVNTEKLPSGIKGLAQKVNDEGLSFGLWFEPEMTNPDSDLYRKHPDWIVSVPNITPSLLRNQYMLDLSKREVCDYIVESVSDILGNANVTYVKWDFNRIMADMPYKGCSHKYVLGLYDVFERLITRFPDVLFEGCASGGGRFDPGILAYSPQIWASDNSDAVSRLKIQYSTSVCYPLSTISAHVTASPNHQVGRITPLKTRADVAYAGIFGYELDITKMPECETAEMKKQIEFYKSIRKLVRTGDFYRLKSPYEGNYCCWEIVSKDKTEILLFGCRVLSYENFEDERVYLDGLVEEYSYTDIETGEVFGGDELMFKGLDQCFEIKDFSTYIRHFKAN